MKHRVINVWVSLLGSHYNVSGNAAVRVCVNVCIYLRAASVVFTPNQNVVTLEETERMRSINTNTHRGINLSQTNPVFDAFCPHSTHSCETAV